jgi:hypothetical protein
MTANGGMMRTQVNPARAGGELRAPSRRAIALFSIYLRWYLRRHFHSLRVANAGRIPPQAQPLILFANHASWWDPLIAMLLAQTMLPEREHYAPMDEAALEALQHFPPYGLFPCRQRFGAWSGATAACRLSDPQPARLRVLDYAGEPVSRCA